MTTFSVDLCIVKLQIAVEDAKGGVYTTTKTATLQRAIDVIEQQKAEIEALRRRPVETAEHIGLAVVHEVTP